MADDPAARFLGAVETHDLSTLTALCDGGLDVRGPVAGKAAATWLTGMYTRSDRFAAVLRLLLARGAQLDDPALAPVLLDDGPALRAALAADPALLHHRTTMVCAFTPLRDATLLHVAAEFGLVAAARELLAAGAPVDARAGTDAYGLGGQTPLFHVVNGHRNRGAPVLRLLLDAGADPGARIAGLVWGEGFDWETTLFDLTPLSYAQCGLLPQFHRDARDLDHTVRMLLAAAGRAVPPMANVPNRYLEARRR